MKKRVSPIVGWNDKQSMKYKKKQDALSRNERLANISKVKPDAYAKSVLNGINSRHSQGNFGKDANYDCF